MMKNNNLRSVKRLTASERQEKSVRRMNSSKFDFDTMFPITASVPLNLSFFNISTSAQATTLSPKDIERLTKLLHKRRYVDIIANMLLFLIGAPTNFKVMLLLLQDKLFQQTRHHILIFNLALADCIDMFIMVLEEISKI